MFNAWVTTGSQKHSSKVNWIVASMPLGAPSCDTITRTLSKKTKDFGINIADWEDTAAVRQKWRAALTKQLKEGEEKLRHGLTSNNAEKEKKTTHRM